MGRPAYGWASCKEEIRLTSSWPNAQLLTGHPQPWVVLVVVLALLPWALPSLKRLRWRAFPLLLLATLVQAGVSSAMRS